MTVDQARAGRPRDPRIEQSAFTAVRELLLAGGYASVTMAAVATRAKTTRMALYRRWPALPHLVHEAVFPDDLMLDMHVGADLATDLTGFVRGTRDALCAPVAAAALPELLAASATWPDLHAAMMRRFERAFSALDERLAAAIAAGEAHPDARGDELLRLIIGAVISGVLLTPDELDDAWVSRLSATLLRSLRP
jgi:AcrR family transcriptional regulator